MSLLEIQAEINKINYTPSLIRQLNVVGIDKFDQSFQMNSSFLLEMNHWDHFAVSWWVSAKRTRSYPYARVYDTLAHTGKKITIIPIIKDEGIDGDRDFLQWDTLSLMSLLQVYVIIGYYDSAVKSKKFDHKITKQRFNLKYIKDQFAQLASFQSDALHWNLQQAELAPTIAKKAIDSYSYLSIITGVNMHSTETVKSKIENISSEADAFKNYSRIKAQEAQYRESQTLQPKEKITFGNKASLTIKNYLGGEYYFTSDEARIVGNNVYLAECKHSKKRAFPSLSDIKDGLIKMILFTNLENVTIGSQQYNPKPVLKLTSDTRIDSSYLQSQIYKNLLKEAITNNFKIDLG